MKKLIIITAFLVILVLGCATTNVSQGIVGTVRPGTNTATVYFLDMEIEGYDVTTDEKGLPYAQIPAGQTTFRGRVIIVHSEVAFLAANVAFDLRLEQGKIYLLVGTAENMRWGVSVYENVYNPEYKEANKIAFLPFINQPTLQ
jgi:hypothetical protein